MKKESGSAVVLSICLLTLVAYVVVSNYRVHRIKEDIRTNYDPARAEDLAKMDFMAEVPLDFRPEGLYRYAWQVPEKEMRCSASWYFPKGMGRLKVSYWCKKDNRSKLLEFSASMGYHFEGSVIRFIDVQGDLGVVQKEGYPFVMSNAKEFVISEFSPEDGWQEYAFSKVDF